LCCARNERQLDSWAEAKEEDKFASPYDVTSEKPAH
jgi:hypothetical protein